MSIFGAGLLAHVTERTDRAIESGAVKWTDSELLHLPEVEGYAFEITYAPQLGKKPTPPKDADAPKPPNPFAPPYDPSYYVTEGRDDEEQEAFVILLNKFMVSKCHCLIVTREFAPQSQPPSPALLKAAFEVLHSFERQGSHWQAIYNCGSESGASQPHQHLQMIPLRDTETPASSLIRKYKEQSSEAVFSVPSFPYAHFICRVSPSSDIGNALLLLLNAMHAYFTYYGSESHARGISYNLILSPSTFMLVPRSRADGDLGPDISPLSINALAFSGCVLVKDEKQLARVRELGGRGLLDILAHCAYEAKRHPPHQDADLDAE